MHIASLRPLDLNTFPALNPNWKVAYMEEEWDKEFYDAG